MVMECENEGRAGSQVSMNLLICFHIYTWICDTGVFVKLWTKTLNSQISVLSSTGQTSSSDN